MLPSQKVKITWNTKNKNKYIQLGYEFTKMGDELYVDITEISSKSHIVISAVCDYCGKELHIQMGNYTRSVKNNPKIACCDCKNIKTTETMNMRYGVSSPAKIDEFRNKMKQTNLERYGFENPMQNQEVQQKQVQSVRDNLGCDYPMQSQIVKEKSANTWNKKDVSELQEIQSKKKQTCIERYGVENPAKCDEFVEKAKSTCLERYNGKSSQCDPNIRKKSFETMLAHDNLPSSKPERALIELLKTIYGEDKCKEHFILDKICFDCLLTINGINIDVEYDGWYWHKNKQDKDKNRDFYAQRRGYKVLRIISNETIPTKAQIEYAVNYLTNTQHNRYKINLIDIKEEDIV